MAACQSNGWRTAERGSAGIAPDAETTKEAVIVSYSAATYGWRGMFADHTWIATKRTGESRYTIYEVVGWRAWRGLSVVSVSKGVPDRYWFGSEPRELIRLQGESVEQLIDKVEKAAENYPWASTYRAFPGPNSNTFIAWIGREVPELELNLPWRALGKGYLARLDGAE